MKGGPFALKFCWLDLAFVVLTVSVKKWTFQCEVCGLEKKGHGKNRAFFALQKAPTKKQLYILAVLSHFHN